LSDSYALATYPTGTAASPQSLKQLRLDSTTLNNNFATAANSAVTVGAVSQTLSLTGSTVSIDGNATSTHSLFPSVTTGSVNIVPNLTGTLNIGNNSTDGSINIGNDSGNSVATTNIRGTSLNLQSSSVIFLRGTQINIIGTGVNVTHSILNGLTSCGIHIGESSTGSQQINIGRSAASINFITLGTQNLTNITLAGNSLSLIGLSPNISSISALAVGASRVLGLPQEMCIALSSETGAVVVSTTPGAQFRIPRAWRILGVRANLYTPSTSGSVSIDIRSVATGVTIPTSVAGGTSIFTTPLSIDSTRMSSVASTTGSVLTTAANTAGLSDDTGMGIFVTGAGTGAAGAKVILYYCVIL
jgi:hypothetical protein